MLNIVLGAGLLILPGLAAQAVGVASLWAWLASIAAVLPLLWVFAALSAQFPDAGGIAHLVGRAFGRCGFIAAALVFFGAVFLGLPSIALTGGYYYAAAAQSAGIPAWLSDANSAAVVLICIASALNLCAPHTAKKIGAAASILMSSLLIILIIVALLSMQQKMSVSEIKIITGDIIFPEKINWQSARTVFFMIFFAFTGWEVALGMNGEFKNPSRNIPIAIFASFILASLLSLICVLLVLIAGENAWHEAAFVFLIAPSFPNVNVDILIAGGVVLLICVNLFAAIWGVSRVLFSVAENGALPAVIGKINRNGVPKNAVLFFVVIGLFVLFLDRMKIMQVDSLFSYAGLNFFVLYMMATAVAVIKLTHWTQKILALFLLIFVCGLLFAIGNIQNLFYPLTLIIAGILIGVVHKKSYV